MISKNLVIRCTKNMIIFGLINLFISILLFFIIKYDIEYHFNSKLERDHEEYIHHHTLYSEKIEYYGFQFEEHQIKTEDGYILKAWRIPGKKGENNNDKKKRAVIMNHGLLDSGYTFFAHGEFQSLPFILANNGYDCWITNNRGTIFSYEHEDQTKNSFEIGSDYWDFSFHEMARYDIVANINYVKNITNNEKISYVCHSQGCVQFFVGYSMNPIFFENSVEKIGTMGAVLKYKNFNKFFPKVIKFFRILESLEYFKIRNIMSFAKENVKLSGYVCRKALWICKRVINSIVQNDPTGHIEWTNLHNLYYYQPGGTSTKNLIHWLQNLGTSSIRQFDYGAELNLKYYNQTEPLEYDFEKLKNMTIDIFVTASDGDPYCLKEDLKLMTQTFTKAKLIVKEVHNYNHLDYLWGKKAHVDIYKHILNFLNDV